MESGTWARPRVGIGHRDPSQPRRKIKKGPEMKSMENSMLQESQTD
jgi:hypothetical protein